VIEFFLKEEILAVNIVDQVSCVCGESVWVPVVCCIVRNTSEMTIWIILIWLAVFDQELPAWNAASRKLISSSDVTEE
jgi:Na+-transporting NADH:ubiquinone oxidoreductase subunit NqrB